MRRLALALTLIAAVALAASPGTFATFTATSANSAPATTAASFLPVNQVAPVTSGTVALLQSLTATPGTWGYDHSGLTGVVTTGEATVSSVTDQWQVCTPTCVNITGAVGATLSITSTLLTQLGLLSLTNVGFRVRETVSNAYGTAAPTFSNVVTG